MVALFRKHRVEVVPENGESQQMARERVMRVVSDTGVILLCQMNAPEKVGLCWVKKK